ncbi:RNA polymerase factor sigma-70 [bacterium BMS3Bbin07]|nr:RNA polymerase factor sigma-70 [bacterium BMS3Bbin07]
MKTLNDEELVALVKDEDSAEAFDELLKRYRPVIYSIAGRIFYSEHIQHATKYEAILEGESSLGLAIINYDRSEGKFKGYAVKCIKGAVINYINGNKSLIKPLALQRRLLKVKSAIKATTNEKTSDISITPIKTNLMQNYPDEAVYWDKFLKGYIVDIVNHRDDIALDSRLKGGMSVHEVVKDCKETGSAVERKEISRGISRILMDAWLKVIKKEIKNGNKRRLEILYRYYVKGDSSEEIIHWLDSSGLNGYDLFRQAKSRGFRQLCEKYKHIFRNMVTYLNRMFNHIFVGDETESFCDELKVFLQTLADTGILTEGYNAQS